MYTKELIDSCSVTTLKNAAAFHVHITLLLCFFLFNFTKEFKLHSRNTRFQLHTNFAYTYFEMDKHKMTIYKYVYGISLAFLKL